MKHLWGFMALLGCSVALGGGEPENTSYRLPSGERVLRHEALVAATPMEAWTAFTTSEGLQGFAAPLAHIDLRPGGVWESSYAPGARLGDPANIHNEILSYLPGEMLSIRIRKTPPRFPHPEIGKAVWTVMQFRPEDDGTRVIVSMLPWRDGEEWDRVYGLFERGNATVLRRMQQYFESGPIEWPRAGDAEPEPRERPPD